MTAVNYRSGMFKARLALNMLFCLQAFLIRFTLYSRSYCHLCADMLHALQAYSGKHSFAVEVVDVDDDALLVEKYDELVPVLMGTKYDMDPVYLCHYFLDTEKLECFLAG